jgi:hypothetical protein
VNRSVIKFFHKNPTYVPSSKLQTNPLNVSDENTNLQDTNDSYKVTKPAEEEWDQTDTRLAKYGKDSQRTPAEGVIRTMSA